MKNTLNDGITAAHISTKVFMTRKFKYRSDASLLKLFDKIRFSALKVIDAELDRNGVISQMTQRKTGEVLQLSKSNISNVK